MRDYSMAERLHGLHHKDGDGYDPWEDPADRRARARRVEAAKTALKRTGLWEHLNDHQRRQLEHGFSYPGGTGAVSDTFVKPRLAFGCEVRIGFTWNGGAEVGWGSSGTLDVETAQTKLDLYERATEAARIYKMLLKRVKKTEDS